MRTTAAPCALSKMLTAAGLALIAALAPMAAAGAADNTTVAVSRVEPQPAPLNAGRWLDTADRQAVLASYTTEFSKVTPDIGWTGDRSSCTAGSTNPAYRKAIIERVNWFRSMGGVPATVTENAAYSAKAQEAALMMSVSDRLSHEPSSSEFDCWTANGAEAASKSNLYLGRTGPHAITGYMFDPGSGNVSVGHRNWILHPTVRQFGTGDTPGPGRQATNALWVVDNAFGSQPIIREPHGFVAWPARGFVPGEVVYPRWSFSISGADFTGASVTTQRVVNGQIAGTVASPIVFRNDTGGAPSSVIVWEPAGVDTQPSVDETYRITIGNVRVGSVVRSYTYDVTVIGDREAVTPPASSVDIAAFANAAHNDFIGRDATAAEKNSWIQRVGSGTSRHTLVAELTRSEEWATNVVDQMYLDTLGRVADDAGRAFWVQQLRDGMTAARMAAVFYGSPEYIANEGNDIERWITDLYDELLDRPPDSAGLEYWVSEYGRTSSGSIALRFYQADESRRARVQQLYRDLLSRSTDQGGETFWAGVLANGDDLALAANLAASEEYFGRAATTN